MTVVLAHKTTREKAIGIVDRSSGDLFDFGSKAVVMTDQKKEWKGSVMEFSLVAKAGFIVVPLSGTVTVDDTNVTVECELPPLVKNFIGEGKLRASVEKHVSGLLTR
jgi:hypothetical protein